jgi:hypothetical protein
MSKEERRIRDFSSGIRKLGEDSRNYLHRLTQALFLVEQPPVCPILQEEPTERKIFTMNPAIVREGSR